MLNRTCLLLRFLLVTSIVLLLGSRAAADVEKENSIVVKYADLLDPSAYGHSGRKVVDTASLLQNITSPEWLDGYVKDLQRRIEKLDEKAANAILPALKDYYAKLREDTQKEIDELKAAGGDRKVLQALCNDIEPFCEPMAFVLNDALSVARPKFAHRDLMDVALWLPESEEEPAWADLVRSREFFVLTDGKSFVRAFLPGDTAADAYKNAYPVLRHVLSWLDRATPAKNGLDLEVFAYSNDITKCAYTLVPSPQTYTVAGELAPPDGTIPLDLQKLNHFFAQKLKLEGATIDAAGQLVLLGSPTDPVPTLDRIPISLSDFAVAYRAIAHSGHSEPYMSLDPSGNAAVAQVNYGGRLQDTLIGSVTLRCDVRFKTLDGGIDAVSGQQVTNSIRKVVPDFLTEEERRSRTPNWKTVSEESTRFWFYPDTVDLSSDPTGMLLKRARFAAASEREEAYDANGKPLEAKNSAWTEATISHFNANYDRFASVFLEVRELDNVARLLAVATWAHQMATAGKLRVDLDSLMALKLPACKTPRKRPQMLVANFIDENKNPPEVRSVDETQLAIASAPDEDATDDSLIEDACDAAQEFLQAQQNAGRLPANVDLSEPWGVLTGGLDLDMTPRLLEAKPVQPIEGALLDRARQAEAPNANLGRPGWRSTKTLDGPPPPPPPPIEPPHIGGFAEEPPRRWSQDAVAFESERRDHVVLASAVDRKTGQKDIFTFRESGGPVSEHSIYLDEHGTAKAFSFAENGNAGHFSVSRDADGAYAASPTSSEFSVRDHHIGLIEAEMKRTGRAMDAWRQLDSGSDIQAIQHTVDGDTIIAWEENSERSGLRISRDGSRTALDEEALLKALSDDANAKAARYSTPKVQLTALSITDEQAMLQIGNRNPIKIDRKAWDGWWEADAPLPAELRQIAEQIRNQGGELVLMRDAHEARPMRFHSGELSADSRPTRLDGEELNLDTPRLAARLEKEVPGLRVCTDDPSDRVPLRAQARRACVRPADIGYVVLKDVPGAQDLGLLRAIEGMLTKSNLTRINVPADAARVNDVLIAAAHNNRELFDYLQTLGAQRINGRSVLEGKTLVVLTCFEPGNPNLYSEFIERYGCRIVAPTERIDETVVRPVMQSFLEEAAKLNNANPKTVLDLLKQVAHEQSLEAGQRQKAAYEALERLVEQLSDAFPVHDDASGLITSVGVEDVC